MVEKAPQSLDFMSNFGGVGQFILDFNRSVLLYLILGASILYGAFSHYRNYSIN